jgi:hypothetical protein
LNAFGIEANEGFGELGLLRISHPGDCAHFELVWRDSSKRGGAQVGSDDFSAEFVRDSTSSRTSDCGALRGIERVHLVHAAGVVRKVRVLKADRGWSAMAGESKLSASI